MYGQFTEMEILFNAFKPLTPVLEAIGTRREKDKGYEV